MRKVLWIGVVAVSLAVSEAWADTIVLKNGDTLHGKIGQVTEGQIKFQSDALGNLSIDQKKVASYKLDEPVVVERKDAPPVTASVSGENQQLTVDDQPYTFAQIKKINPPPEKWTGSLVFNFALARGNTNKYTVGAAANALLRRDNYDNNDRITLHGDYNYGSSGGGPGNDPKVTDTDDYILFSKYDRFWTPKLYGYLSMKVEHDEVAALEYRLGPNMGLGYQWVESGRLNFNTESGVGYVRERYDTGDENEYVSLRLAYHVDYAFTDTISLIHNVEYLPSFSDPGDYNLNADAGLNVKLIENFFASFKLQFRRDSTPAEGSLKNDVMYFAGFGWWF